MSRGLFELAWNPHLISTGRKGPMYLQGVWNVSESCLEGVWKVSVKCLEGVLRVSRKCLESVRKVSGW